MAVNILSRKFIKPSSPTPRNLKIHKLSITDDIPILVNVPIILFYASSAGNEADLEETLAKILTEFYPFAGRYIAKDHLVDCSDQGAEFVVAYADDLAMLEFMIRDITYSEKVNDLLPRDQATDPVLSVQVTGFKCGGMAIGVSLSHQLADASTVGTFIAAWAKANNLHYYSDKKMPADDQRNSTTSPIFNSFSLFPRKNLSRAFDPVVPPRDPSIVLKMLVFNKEAIMNLKAKANSPASRVRVVCALIAKLLIGLDRAKTGQPRDCLITQAVNIRERTIPPLPKHSCGNFAALSIAKCTDSTKFEELVEVIGEAVGKTIADCAEILSGGESTVHRVFIDPLRNFFKVIADGEMNTLTFTDFTKFGFYDVDFGWGKPVWTSIGIFPIPNFTILMENKERDGIEAWVHLNRKDLAYFEQDEEIRSFID